MNKLWWKWRNAFKRWRYSRRRAKAWEKAVGRKILKPKDAKPGRPL